MAVAGLPLGVGGLPAPLGWLADGELHALALPPGLLDTLLLGLARASLQARRRLAVVCEDPAATATFLARHGIDVARSHQRGSLRLLALKRDQGAAIRRHGPAQWLDELDHYGVGEGAVLAVAPAAHLFDWGSRGALAGYARLYHGWASTLGATAVMLFEDDSLTDDHALQLSRAYRGLHGCARLLPAGEELVWETRHWRGVPRKAPRVYRLRREDDASLAAIPDDQDVIAEWTRRIEQAPDRQVVMATEAALKGLRGWPAHWRVVPEMLDMEQQAARAVAMTCLLALSDLQQYRALAHLVYRLRRQCGRGLTIFVREDGVRLRQGQANLLLALGANRVLSRKLGPAELSDYLGQARHEVFIRPMFRSFESAFLSAIPLAEGGYQAPADFVQHARAGAQRARQGGLECALVRFFPLPAVSPLEALRQVRTVRPGDLCTADDCSVYLFLFACWQDDVNAAIERIVRHPVEQLFEGQIRNVVVNAVLSELNDLSSRLPALRGCDYREALAAVPPPESAAEDGAETADGRPEGRKQGRRVRPAPLRLLPSA